MSKNVGRYTLTEDSYEAVCALPLECGFYVCRRTDSEFMAEMVGTLFDRNVAWKVRAFANFAHLEGVLRDWTPDILITHWHEDEYVGWDDEETNVSRLVRKLRENRGGPYVGQAPFIVGEYWGHDEKFLGQYGRERIAGMLTDEYDMLFDAFAELDVLPWNIAIGIWNMLESPQGEKGTEVPFDPLFDGHLAGRRVREKDQVDFGNSEQHYNKRMRRQDERHNKRIRWLIERTG